MLDPLKEEDPDRVGPFAIEARLGAGGSGRVYLGRAVDGTAAAVRVMPPGDPGLRDRFAALARVLGEHTAALVGADPEAEHPWLATEYVAGPPLTEVVAERGALPVPEVLRLTAGVAGALAALHAAGVVHRDLKPHNVLLAPAGPRVIDAGVARDEGAGVPGDVLALGELITFLATGGTDPMPEALRALVARCTAPDPTDRPTAAEVRTLCDAALSGPPTLTAPAAEEVSVQDTIDALPHTAIVGPVPIPAPEGASGSDTEPSAPDTDAPDRDTAETTPAPPAPEIADPTADVTDSGHRTANITGPAPTEDIATEPPPNQPATNPPHPNAGKPDTTEPTPLAGATALAKPADGTPPTATVRPVVATERTAPAPADTPDTNGPAPAATEDIAPDSPSPDQPDATEPTPLAGATVLARPPANPLDLSAGIPSDAVVGPVVATGPESATDAAHPLAYPAASPPANPIDLSAGIPSDAIVGPVVATGPESATDAAHPLAYPSADPPANPIDLSAGIPSDAIVGPVPAPDESETPAITASLAYPPAQPPDNPLDLSAGIPPDAIVGPVPAPATENTTPTAADSLAYPAGSPPANPLDLSAGIPSDAIVGPVPAPENTEPPTALSAVPDTDTGPSDLTGGPVPGPGTEPGVPDAGPAEPHAVEHTGPVIEPIDYTTTPPRGFALRRRPATRPARHRKRNPSSPHRRLAGLAVALVLAVVALPLVRDSAIPGEPVAAPATSATPATEDQAAPGDTPGPNCAGSKDLRASGSSFQRDAMVGVADGWAARCPGSAFDYTPGGTALGLRQFGSGEADFAVTDHPLGEVQGEIAIAAARCAGTGASADKDLVFESPMVLTPIVLAYRLPGIPGLRLDATTVAAIFDGRVTAWNDKAIVTLNAGVRLPATKITVLSRTGKAQSTQTFQQYLTAVGGWRKGDGPEFAGGPSLAMPSDLTIMAAIRNIDGAIGYLPYSVTRPTDEPVAMIVTGNGKAAIPGSDAVHAAVAAALHASDDLDHLPDAIFRAGADQVGDGTAPYPLVHVGYVVACTRYPDDVRAAAVRDFLLVALATSAGPASGYELPSGDLRDRLVEFVERTY